MDERDFIEIRNRLRFLCEVAIGLVALGAGYYVYQSLLQHWHWSNGLSLGCAYVTAISLAGYLRAQSDSTPMFDDWREALSAVAGLTVLGAIIACLSF